MGDLLDGSLQSECEGHPAVSRQNSEISEAACRDRPAQPGMAMISPITDLAGVGRGLTDLRLRHACRPPAGVIVPSGHPARIREHPGAFQVLHLFVGHRRKPQLERVQGIDHHGGDDDASEFLVVGRHDDQGVGRRGMPDGLLVRLLVVVPPIAFLEVSSENFQFFSGRSTARETAPSAPSSRGAGRTCGSHARSGRRCSSKALMSSNRSFQICLVTSFAAASWSRNWGARGRRASS